MDNEILKEIENYEGLYMVSSFGRVFSVRRNKFLKPSNNKDNYRQVVLYKNGKPKTCKIHRIVATAFLPNPLHLPQVNHKDENPSNNKLENLEWCTAKYNVNYGTRTEKTSKKVLQLTKQGEFVKEFPSTIEAERQTKIHHSHISQCCLGKIKTSGGYIWRFKDAS